MKQIKLFLRKQQSNIRNCEGLEELTLAHQLLYWAIVGRNIIQYSSLTVLPYYVAKHNTQLEEILQVLSVSTCIMNKSKVNVQSVAWIKVHHVL